jgi:hypothetical protein
MSKYGKPMGVWQRSRIEKGDSAAFSHSEFVWRETSTYIYARIVRLFLVVLLLLLASSSRDDQ